MNKFAVSVLMFFICLSFSPFSQATLITNLTQVELDSGDYSDAEDHLTSDLLGVNYINYKGYDWAWVSSMNIEFSVGNTLYAPEVQKEWQFADNTLLNILKNELTLSHFTDDDGALIQSLEFFNSNETLLASSSLNDFNNDFVSSEWTIPGSSLIWQVLKPQDTFYVREALSPVGNPTPIPEPLSIIIFATALLALQIKLKKK